MGKRLLPDTLVHHISAPMSDEPALPPPLPALQSGLTRKLKGLAARAGLAAGVGTFATLASLGHAALYFMLAGSFFGSADRKYSIGHRTAGGMPLTYLALALLCVYPTLKLFALQSAIGRWMQSQSPEDLAEVMRRKTNLASELKTPVLLVALLLCQIFFG